MPQGKKQASSTTVLIQGVLVWGVTTKRVRRTPFGLSYQSGGFSRHDSRRDGSDSPLS